MNRLHQGLDSLLPLAQIALGLILEIAELTLRKFKEHFTVGLQGRRRERASNWARISSRAFVMADNFSWAAFRSQSSAVRAATSSRSTVRDCALRAPNSCRVEARSRSAPLSCAAMPADCERTAKYVITAAIAAHTNPARKSPIGFA